ncbi:conserved hypothetical protein [uncultured Desulfobacterium sp.]|uniref:CBM20 domain-containing protein n=1 Tax=uncultured Desulfobacterium sp. TaxID=201089 RepID=A0A445N428_9BACT|nr:conserved hypothetical protein [uncultured Desulfobacterium sp.]
MSIIKKYIKNKPMCKVTFKLTKEEAQSAEKVHIVGEFNNWDGLATPMKKLKNGDYTATVDLKRHNEYQFRYLKNNEEWDNDPDADKYVSTPFGDTTNSVVVV